jgi:hypothetical protein
MTTKFSGAVVDHQHLHCVAGQLAGNNSEEDAPLEAVKQVWYPGCPVFQQLIAAAGVLSLAKHRSALNVHVATVSEKTSGEANTTAMKRQARRILLCSRGCGESTT